MSRARCYEITPEGGGATYLATAAQLAKASGRPLRLIQKRLGQQGIRDEARLFRCPQEALRLSRAKFLAQTSAHFSEEKRTRAAKAAHEEEVAAGHADV